MANGVWRIANGELRIANCELKSKAVRDQEVSPSLRGEDDGRQVGITNEKAGLSAGLKNKMLPNQLRHGLFGDLLLGDDLQ